MGLDFVKNNGGLRVSDYPTQPLPTGDPLPDEEDPNNEAPVRLGFEHPITEWEAINTSANWRTRIWEECPRYFVDGKDVGRTIAWIQSPSGHPVPIRLSQIGSIVMCADNEYCRREFYVYERVVTMAADLFAWDQVESFAADLQTNGFRLLMVTQPPDGYPFEFEKMRQMTETRSNTEMTRLEAVAVSRIASQPSIVDGRLEPRDAGLDRLSSPVFGVIKTQRQTYLHKEGLELLYRLPLGHRTPMFSLPNEIFPVASWYVRLSGRGETPNWGIIRVEVSLEWFEAKYPNKSDQTQFANCLSHVISQYRSREQSYRRAAVSLHPIVRAEESLGAVFSPHDMIMHKLYRLLSI